MATKQRDTRKQYGPRRTSPGEYRNVGVELISKDPLWLRCEVCGCRWSPNYISGGRLRRLHWVCPEYRCNA